MCFDDEWHDPSKHLAPIALWLAYQRNSSRMTLSAIFTWPGHCNCLCVLEFVCVCGCLCMLYLTVIVFELLIFNLNDVILHISNLYTVISLRLFFCVKLSFSLSSSLSISLFLRFFVCFSYFFYFSFTCSCHCSTSQRPITSSLPPLHPSSSRFLSNPMSLSDFSSLRWTALK